MRAKHHRSLPVFTGMSKDPWTVTKSTRLEWTSSAVIMYLLSTLEICAGGQELAMSKRVSTIFRSPPMSCLASSDSELPPARENEPL